MQVRGLDLSYKNNRTNHHKMLLIIACSLECRIGKREIVLHTGRGQDDSNHRDHERDKDHNPY